MSAPFDATGVTRGPDGIKRYDRLPASLVHILRDTCCRARTMLTAPLLRAGPAQRQPGVRAVQDDLPGEGLFGSVQRIGIQAQA